MAEEIVIDAAELSYQVGRQYLLQEVSWRIKLGEHWILFGLNGSGKTTLLSILAGYNEQTEGSLRVFGQAYDAQNLLAHRQKIGLVSSSFFDQYYHEESVLEIVLSAALGTLGLDFDLEEIWVKRAKILLEKLGLTDKTNRSYSTLSKGERENVLIARALLTEPEILMLDEPCAGLDILSREKMLSTVTALADGDKTTLIYVTHYAEEVLPCFEKALFLRQGSVYKSGNREDLFNQDAMGEFLQTKVTITQEAAGRLSIAVQDKRTLEWSRRGEQR